MNSGDEYKLSLKKIISRIVIDRLVDNTYEAKVHFPTYLRLIKAGTMSKLLEEIDKCQVQEQK